jgi:hypothetical protein
MVVAYYFMEMLSREVVMIVLSLCLDANTRLCLVGFARFVAVCWRLHL